MTDKPFGVNLTFLPAVTQPDYPGYVRAIIDGGVTIVETAGNNPQKWLPALKDAGIQGDPQVHVGPPFAEGASRSAATPSASTASSAAATRAKTMCRTSSCCRARRRS